MRRARLIALGVLVVVSAVTPVARAGTTYAARGSGTPLRLNSAGEAVVVGADGSVVAWKADGTPMGPMPKLPGGTWVVASGFTDPPAPNRMGLVWGYGDTGGGEHAVLWDPLVGLVDAGTLAGTALSRPIGMDADGWMYAVCGNAFETHPLSGSTLGQRAFVWHPSQPDVRIEIQPPVPAYDLIQLKDITPGGKVQVSSWTAGYLVSNTAYVWDRPSQAFIDLHWGGDVGEMNDNAEIVAGGTYWSSAGEMESLYEMFPEVPLDVASMISNSGWVTGTSINGVESVFVLNLRDTRDGRVPAGFDLGPEIQAASGIAALPSVVTELGQVVGLIWVYDQAGTAQHVFFWDDQHGLSDLTPGRGSEAGSVFIHSVGPTGKVVFGTSEGLFSWQRVDGIGVTTSLDGLVGTEPVVPPYYWVWQPTKLSNAIGQVLARDAEGDCFLVTPGGATSPGSNVAVQPDANTSITFAGIVTPGETSVVAYDIDDPLPPAVPADFALSGTGALLNISTTATFTGSVELAIHYDQGTMPEGGSREQQIRLLHFVDPQWVDVTDYARPGGFLDKANNIVYGKVTSFSPFAIVEILDSTPPVIAHKDDLQVDASSTLGATVTFTAPTATDDTGGPVPVTCVPASGTLFPVGVTTVTCTASDTHQNTATSTFDVIVRIDPRYLKGAVADSLNTLISTSDKKTVKRLLKAIGEIEDSLATAFWVDDFHLTKKGREVFKEESEAAAQLMAIESPPALVTQALLSLVEADRVLAATALAEATAANPTSTHLAAATAEMVLGTASNASAAFGDAIRHYRKAWKSSMKALGLL